MSSAPSITIAQFGAPHGVQGWLRLHSFTSPIDNVLQYHSLKIKRGETLHPIEIAEARVRGKDILVSVSGYNDRDKARELTLCEVVIDEAQLPTLEHNEFYWHQLIGLRVFDVSNTYLGDIVQLFETGSNDVIVVKKQNDKQTLIPYLDHVVRQVDLAKKMMVVDWELLD